MLAIVHELSKTVLCPEFFVNTKNYSLIALQLSFWISGLRI